MIIFQLTTVGLSSSIPAPGYGPPSQKIILQYLSAGAGLDNCGEIVKTYVNIVANGGSRSDASAIAEQVYKQQNLGRPYFSSGCKAAMAAWRSADDAGQDPALPAALAFIRADPAAALGVAEAFITRNIWKATESIPWDLEMK